MVTLQLPSMVAGRRLADTLVDAVSVDLAGADVVVDCGRLVSASPSFVAQLLSRLLLDAGAATVRVRRPTDQFVRYAAQVADELQVRDRVELESARAVPA